MISDSESMLNFTNSILHLVYLKFFLGTNLMALIMQILQKVIILGTSAWTKKYAWLIDYENSSFAPTPPTPLKKEEYHYYTLKGFSFISRIHINQASEEMFPLHVS